MKNLLGPIIIALSIITGALIISSNPKKTSNVRPAEDCYKKVYLAKKESYSKDLKDGVWTEKQIDAMASNRAMTDCGIK